MAVKKMETVVGDASMNMELNGVRIEREPAHADLIVPWAVAFPRDYWTPEFWESCR